MEYGLIFEKCNEIKWELIRMRRELHKIPEVGFATSKTRCFIINELEKLGLNARFLGGGIVCDIEGSGEKIHSSFINIDEKRVGEVTEIQNFSQAPKSCVVLRADIDALPINEETELDFKAENGNMHACGHDMHTASLLGCARVISQMKNEFCGTVRLVFQSAEESLSGAKEMIEGGVLENPRADACIAIHVVVSTDFETGTAILPNVGISAPFADFFKITVTGSGGHGALPNESKNAALCGAAIALKLNEASVNEGGKDFCITVCQLTSGHAPNVIPEKCEIHGTFRSISRDARKSTEATIKEICKTVADDHACSAKFEITSSTESLYCDENLSKYAEECLILAYNSPLNETNASVIRAQKSKLKASTPSEDFSLFASRTPSVLIGICAGKISDGYSYPLHNPRVAFDEDSLVYGAAVYSSLALAFLADSRAPKFQSQGKHGDAQKSCK